MAEIRERLDLAAAGLYRGLAGPMSELVAQGLGLELGFSARYVALVHHRDAMLRALQDSPSNERAAWLRQRITDLEDELGYENPDNSRGSSERLAFAALRHRCGLTQRGFAVAHARRIGGNSLEQALKLRNYESEQPGEDGDLNGWLETMRRLPDTPVAIDRREFARLATALGQVHPIKDTMSWSPVTGLLSRGPMQVFAPEKDARARSMRWGRSSTAFSAIRVEAIEVVQPAEVSRGPLRLVNASHASFELAVLVRGRIALDVSRTRFPEERPGAPPRRLPDELLSTSEMAAGDILALQARLWHRVEFLGADNLLLLIIIEQNVNLARRIGRRTTPDSRAT